MQTKLLITLCLTAAAVRAQTSGGLVQLMSTAVSCFQNFCDRSGEQPYLSAMAACPLDGGNMECVVIEAGGDWCVSANPNCYTIGLPNNYCSLSVLNQIIAENSGTMSIIDASQESGGSQSFLLEAENCYENFCQRSGSQPILAAMASCPTPNGNGVECVVIEPGTGWTASGNPSCYTIVTPNDYCDQNVMNNLFYFLAHQGQNIVIIQNSTFNGNTIINVN